MMLKSKPDHYGAVAVTLHWLNAILILVMLYTGFQAASAIDAASKAAFLRIHLPAGLLVLFLSAFRLVWWWRFDQKTLPVEGAAAWQENAARWSIFSFTSSFSA